MPRKTRARRFGGPEEMSSAMSANGTGFLGYFARIDTLSPIYAGTVPYAEVQRRRARNKRARHARRINRLAAER